MSKTFQEYLAELPTIDQVAAIELATNAGEVVARIENRPGTAASARLYHALFTEFGSITVEAAQKGIIQYAEHTEDAKVNPGKHPNIDRLFAIEKGELSPLSVTVIAA
ncbi:DUF2322 family protein [Leeia sp. TBRC 13508]|uniref:DUF2322 family protein n=1 Tax=Leeia speluncae TaxID=2884804 RepID=A0ABS8D7E9_9NEIS|nr:DUF2322 family protein [Leeia speluncae]MCB6184130.1 DUF2322 family protein [Leeia speluncae]